MSDDIFDPEAFLDSTTEGEMATNYEPVPEGDYSGVVKDVKARKVDRNGADPLHILEVTWSLDAPDLAEKLNRQELTCRQSVFLDIGPNGGLEGGANKNVALGRLREALGQNNGGAWSPSRLIGAGPAIVHVSHRQDKDDPSKKYDEIKHVRAA